MGEPFDVSTDDTGDTSLTPTFQEPDVLSPADVGILPNTARVMGPMPQMPLPPPPPVPPSPLHDPRQQLLALAALGMAIGQGPRGGGAGAFQGFMQGQQVLQNDQMQRHQMAVAENLKQQSLIAAQQRAAETDYRQREASLQKALINFKTSAEKAPDKASYDALADAYGNSLRVAGFRTMSPDWLRANIPYMKPSEEKVATKAFNDWLKNPNNKRVLDENPQAAFASLVEVDLNGDGVKERIPLPLLAEKAGQGFAKTDQGYVAAPKGVTGNGAFDVKYNALLQQFVAENRREPKPDERNKIVDSAIAATKVKAEPAPRDPLDEEYKSLRNAKMKADAAGGEGGDILEGTPEYRRAEDIAFGKLTLQQAKGLYGFRDKSKLRAIMDKAEEINPDFNAAQFEMGYRFAGNPKTQMAMVAVNRVEPNINKLIELSNKWDRTKYPTINDFLRSVKFQWGDRTVSDFGQLQTIVGDELGPALGVGSATDLKTRLGLEMAGGSKGKDNFRSGLMLVKDALNNQKRALLGQMGPYGQPTSEATPDLSGLSAGQKRTFKAGPFAGQSWTIGPDGKGKQIS